MASTRSSRSPRSPSTRRSPGSPCDTADTNAEYLSGGVAQRESQRRDRDQGLVLLRNSEVRRSVHGFRGLSQYYRAGHGHGVLRNGTRIRPRAPGIPRPVLGRKNQRRRPKCLSVSDGFPKSMRASSGNSGKRRQLLKTGKNERPYRHTLVI